MKKIVLFLAIGLMTASSSIAQKFGYIDSRELLSLMPEMVKADTALKVYAKQYSDQLEAMEKEFNKKGQEYQAGEKSMSEAVKEVKQKELQSLQQRYQDLQQSAQEKMGKKENELLSPILEKADKAIKEVAKAGNYDYVFDLSKQAILYAKDSDNMLPLVKAKLGIK